MQLLSQAWAFLVAHPELLALLLPLFWQIVTALLTGAFGAADKCALSHPRFAVVLRFLEHAGFNARAALALLAKLLKQDQGPPPGGASATVAHGAPMRECSDLEDEDKTLPSGRSILGAMVIAASFALLGFVCVVSVNSCKQFDMAVHDMQPAAACIAGALANGGTEDPMVIIAECAGTTIEDIIKVIGDLLDNAPDASALPDGSVGGMSPGQRAHLIRTLENAYHAKAAAAYR